jgi:protein TonB
MAARLRRRRDPVSDRLATAVFVAALAHGLFILGVKFATPALDRQLPTLEILLQPDGADDPKVNEHAAYLAQRTRHGHGTGDTGHRTSLPEAQPQPADAKSTPVDPDAVETSPAMPRGDVSVLSKRTFDAERLPAGADTPDTRPLFYAQPSTPAPTVALNASLSGRELHLHGQSAPDGTLLADTRESAIATYLDGWKRRIERVGTLNFPNEARRQGMSGSPVVEVAVHADGTLETAVVRRTSGHPVLDDAAIGIVRIAAPFDPFPTALRERYPVLRFAYEWQFQNGRLGGDGTIYTSDP